MYNGQEEQMPLEIHRSWMFQEIRDLVQKQSNEFETLQVTLCFTNGALIDLQQTLVSANVQSGDQINAIIEVVQHDQNNQDVTNNDFSGQVLNQSSQKVKLSELSEVKEEQKEPEMNFVPSEPHDGCVTSPPYEQLKQMTMEQLQQVDQFQISNQHGSILFVNQTDVTYVDLASTVQIDKKGVEVYPEGVHKHPIGQKLNKEAIVTINNVKSKKLNPVQLECNLIQKLTDQPNCQHESYDQNTLEWKFRVAHH